MTQTRAVGLLAAAAVLLAGCASAGSSPQRPVSPRPMTPGMAMPAGASMGPGAMTPGMVMPDGSTMGPGTMGPGTMAPGSPGTAPSDAAKMICTLRTRDNIATVLSVPPPPDPVATWSGGTYACTYHLAAGPIVMSVHESADDTAAAAYTAAVRRTLPTAKDLVGLTSTAFGTADGLVVLRKDNDTLRVDATALSPQSGRLYAKRSAFAYLIAAIVLGCWTGD